MNTQTLTNEENGVFCDYLASMQKHHAMRKAENARRREQRLQKIAPVDAAVAAPRLNLTEHLHAAVPAIVDAGGERHEPAGLIKALHVAGGAPLQPQTAPALRKVDTVPALAAAQPAPRAFEPPATSADYYALLARQEHDDREEVSGLMRKALTGPSLAIGGQR